jgi:hypothetical protein
MSAKATAAAMLASAPTMEDVMSGAIRIPDEILEAYEIENDLPIQDQAYYPATMDTDTSSSPTRGSNGEDVGGGNHDPNRPPFSVRDAILGDECAFDEMIHPSAEFFSSTMHFVPGKNFMPIYRRSEWGGQKMYCRYEGHELDDGCEIIMHPEEWTPEPNEIFKLWGTFCSEPCWRTWLDDESKCANKGQCILAQRRIAIVTMRDSAYEDSADGIGYKAPCKHGLLQGWNGNMDIQTFRSLTKRGSSVPKHTERLVTNARFIPTPVLREINIYNHQLAAAHYQCADDFYRMGHVTEQERDKLLETMPQHASAKLVEAGVWFDDETKSWMDVHNMAALEGNGHCFTPAR